MSEAPDVNHPRTMDREFVGGVAWTAAAKWISQLVSWPSVFIAARYLSTSDFGVVEMAGFYFTLTNVLAEFGVGTALLQMRELERETIEEMNSVSLLMGAIACGLTIAMAPLVAMFFHAPLLKHLIRVYSVFFVLIGLQVIPLGMLQRDMDYRKLSIAETFQSFVQGGVTIACAVGGLGYWTLIFGNMAGRAASVLLTMYWKPVRMSFPHWRNVSAPLRMGLEIAFQRIAWTMYLQSDGIVIGRLLGQSVLGSYRMAISVASAPADKIGMLIMRVTGPLFARIQADKTLMKRYFLVLSEVMSLVLFPLVSGLSVVAPEIVHVLLKPEWSGAVAAMRWLAIFTVIRLLGSLAGQALLSLRFTRFSSWMVISNVVLMPATFYLVARTGSGSGAVASAWVWMAPFTVLPAIVKLLGAVECGKWKYLESLMPAFLSSLVMVAGVAGLKGVLPGHWPVISRLGAEVAAGGIIYGSVLFGVFGKRVRQFIRFFLELRKSPDAIAA